MLLFLKLTIMYDNISSSDSKTLPLPAADTSGVNYNVRKN